MFDAASIELPSWARVGARRRAHIARVMALLESWSEAMGMSPAEARLWRDAGRLHDALRDASEGELRALVPELAHRPAGLLHGPAAAVMLARDGETRCDLLEAVRWHTVGCAGWGRVGRALYMADYLEPGRRFDRGARDELAARVPGDFAHTFRDVVAHRVQWAVREGNELYPETVALWNAVR